ncbi:MAG: hypothetical protein F6J87_30175 [Spirulina sp. SIO3F2]|nr:hypothetical protein [Spirulina sp. SIO3F2]
MAENITAKRQELLEILQLHQQLREASTDYKLKLAEQLQAKLKAFIAEYIPENSEYAFAHPDGLVGVIISVPDEELALHILTAEDDIEDCEIDQILLPPDANKQVLKELLKRHNNLCELINQRIALNGQINQEDQQLTEAIASARTYGFPTEQWVSESHGDLCQIARLTQGDDDSWALEVEICRPV